MPAGKWLRVFPPLKIEAKLLSMSNAGEWYGVVVGV